MAEKLQPIAAPIVPKIIPIHYNRRDADQTSPPQFVAIASFVVIAPWRR
jgi:hypothetical protein